MITTPPNLTDAHSGPTLIATRGLPAAGKTTWALNELDGHPPGTIARCNRDDLRRMLHGAPRYDRESEAVVTVIQHDAITVLLRTGQSVIVDDTNLDDDHLYALAVIAHTHGATFREQDFRHVPLETCIARDLNRTSAGGHVGEDVIRRMHARYLAGADSQ